MGDFDWSGYLILAQRLAGQGRTPVPPDAMLRSAISRAYYAAFNKARWHLRYVEFDINIPDTGDAHAYVRQQFETHPDIRRKEIAVNLERLLGARKRADYRDTFSRLEGTAQLSLQWAEEVFSALENL